MSIDHQEPQIEPDPHDRKQAKWDEEAFLKEEQMRHHDEDKTRTHEAKEKEAEETARRKALQQEQEPEFEK